jgi:hypothetical protein
LKGVGVLELRLVIVGGWWRYEWWRERGPWSVYEVVARLLAEGARLPFRQNRV